jgi:glutamate synthase domain-containing protein 3
MVEIDASQFSVRELNRQIRSLAESGETEIRVLHPGAQHNIGVGIVHPITLTIQGSAGYFCAGLCDGPNVTVDGNVGWGFGDNLMNGRLEVKGNAGAVCGVAMRSGQILIHGNMGSRSGQVMKGGSIVCRGDAGYRAGSMMMGGTIIILGSTREALAEFMMDGEIFVAGEISGLGTDAQETEFSEADRTKVNEILGSHGLSHAGPFRKIISDQRALRYTGYEKGELLFDKAREQKAELVAADGNRDAMEFDSD